MNVASVIILIIVAVIFCIALIFSIKNKGKCSGCNGDCSHCPKIIKPKNKENQ